ncbi:MAG: GumC family protein [Pseudoxanthomonas sp.]|nr:GumC family protein [Pseudoxanthomonas sp.]
MAGLPVTKMDAYSHDGPAESTLAEYATALYRRRWLVIAIAAAVVLVALVVTLAQPTLYQATTMLQIERESMKVVAVEELMPAESPMDRDFYQTQYELLTSRSLTRRVIARTGLASHPAYRDYVDEPAEKTAAPGAIPSEPAAERALTDRVLASLQVEPVRNSRMVKVHFESPDPELSARVANAYASEFIAAGLERRLKASELATGYLSERLAQIRQRLEDSERNFVKFAGQEQIVSVGDDKPSLPAQNLAELNALLATAQAARIKSEADWQQAAHSRGMALPQVVSNPLIQNLMQTRAQLSADYQLKLSTFKPDYPEMRRLRGQIGEVDRQVNQHVTAVRESIKATYEAADAQEKLLEARIGELKADELDLQDRSIRYNMLKREVDTNRQLYDGLLQRFKEIGVAGNVGANNISVIDVAEVPTMPSSPRTLFNLALATILGVGAGILVALLLHVVAVARASSNSELRLTESVR